MTKQVKESAVNTLELDKVKIDEKIASDGEYTSEGILIKKWVLTNDENENSENKGKDQNKYLTSLQKNGCQYTGTLNEKFQRDGYGLEVFENGDKYFGLFESDVRNDKGIYYFAPRKNPENENSTNIQSECYLGQWKNNVKDKYGIYIWMDQPENNYEYDNANFEAYVGEFDDEKYVRGTYLSKLNNEYYLYHGNFDQDGKKNDNNAYFFSSKSNKIFHGKIIKDVLVNGYLGSFDAEGENVTEVVYCKFNEDGSVNDVIEQNKLNEEDVQEETKNIKNFRSIIFDGDTFGKIYNKFTKIKAKIDRLEDMIEVLEKEDNIAEIEKILNKYNKKNIYFYIEENFFGRKM